MRFIMPVVRFLVLAAVFGGGSYALAADAPAAANPATDPAAVKKREFDALVKDAKRESGLLTVYQKGTKLYGEIPAGHLNKDFIVLISIAKGIGQNPLLGGMSWGFGDDWIWQFRKVDDRILIVRKNVRFTAAKGSPEEKAVDLAYTDSVLFSLPIVARADSGADVVDLSQVFMSDLPQIGRLLPGFAFSEPKSQWAAVKAFKDNVELEVAATYASGGMANFDSVADSRGATINVHYSISLLPQTGYQPRMADDRIGYFLTVLKDYSLKTNDDRFVRYINRWDLRKADPTAALSPPQKPIIFWLEKTIPFAYRKPIRDGILEWNRAFETAGFVNAIEVRQQPDNADWDPEDINYNTFRWITSSAGFAMGPSRVNPMTGQILDADIIFDADFLSFWKDEYETFTPEGIARMTGGPLDLQAYQELAKKRGLDGIRCGQHCCELHSGLSREFAFGASMLAARTSSPAEQEKLIMQGLKEVAMHELGHTLGLRHNFKASTLLTLEEMSDVSKTAQTGLSASVMDYAPANIVPQNAIQGDYFSQTIGPYDLWAIEYGYKPFSGGTTAEVAELNKIAARSGEPGHVYSTDEDTRGIDPDPLSNRFDLGKDPVAYARQRATLISELLPKAIDEAVKNGEGYEKARQVFGILLGNYGTAMYFSARNIGGLYVSRSHKADPNAQPPFVVVDAAHQRAALELLEQNVFNDKPFQFPPDMYNRLAASRWNHWGSEPPLRPDYPAHAVIEMWQARILEQLLSPLTLERLHDSELKVPADQDAFTLAELMSRLTGAIFAEVSNLPQGEFSNRKPAISSLRRNLQRHYLKRLGSIALGQSAAPEDAQTIAYAELAGLQGKLDAALKANPKLDSYSKAHLEESKARIQKIIDSRLTATMP